ncbi:MAG: carbon-nitrogen hydrolase family protein [Lentisphaerae bacterium]|nr:carbon-nitrogen hydrolase family protein [Lentisphaerota bacterium]
MRADLTLALAQMTSTPDWERNLRGVADALAGAAGGCDLVVFPENALCLGSTATILREARPAAALTATLGALCRQHRQAAVFGGVAVADGAKARNSSLLFDAEGRLLARYDKMHLFQLEPGRPGGIDETEAYTYGDGPVAIEVNGWRIGLTICYDLRFPELMRAYAGADLVLCTAAFTRQTGAAHWEVLLRARAIENLCYVAGAGLCGSNPETGTRLHGHSMVVDPWGDVIARADADQPGLLRVSLDAARLAAVRERLPALQHRRLGPG